MTTNLKTLLQSELSGATSYIQRLIQALTKITELDHLESVRKISADFDRDLRGFLQETLLQEKFATSLHTSNNISLTVTSETLKNVENIITSSIRLGVSPEQILHDTVAFINMVYEYAHELHALVEENTELEVQFPRLNLVEVHGDVDFEEEETSESFQFSPEEAHEEDQSFIVNLPLFYLSAETLKQHTTSPTHQNLASLDTQRGRKYEDLLSRGHEAVYHKRNEDALDKFVLASEYSETAEVLTLIGWVHSLMGNNEPAKSHCLRAIRKDPDYGPPYNDLGSYLLAEGQVDESLRWFDLAKKCPVYQNREYPYINAGRAYIAKRDYQKALDEFGEALTLAPYHQELQQTVDKLKKSLKKKEWSTDADPSTTPFNQ